MSPDGSLPHNGGVIELRPESSARLDRFLAAALPEHSRSKLVRWIELGKVFVDNKVERASFEVKQGMVVSLEPLEEKPIHDLTPADIPIDVIFEDEFMMVVNKPRHLATHPAASLQEPSLVNALLARNTQLSEIGGDFRPGIVHRLDKDTTGLLMIAKTDAAHVVLARQIEEKTAERRYLAITGGEIVKPRITISAPIARDKKNRLKMAVDAHGKPAVTHIRVLRHVNAGQLLVCRLETGRTHQIRVHLSSIGCPVIGDTMYAPKSMQTAELQLHAAFLEFNHPVSGERRQFFAPAPEDFLGQATAEEVSE